jgi:Trk K+ transport system NAD-binding subunit
MIIVKIQGTTINSNHIVAIEKTTNADDINLVVVTVAKTYSFKYKTCEARNEAFNKLECIMKRAGRFYEV